MFNSMSLADKIKHVRGSIVAIAFNPQVDRPEKLKIVASGFCISNNGKILTVAHLLGQLNDKQKDTLKALVMFSDDGTIQSYELLPLKLLKENKKTDLALFQLENYEKTLLKKLELGNSDSVEVGHDVYFIGFPYATELMKEGFGVSLIVNKGIVSSLKHDGTDSSHGRNWVFVDSISNLGHIGYPLLDVESNKVIGVMSISFRTRSQTVPQLDIREPMHIAGAKPINLVDRKSV